MPKYVYHCEKCEKFFEIVHSIKEKMTDCEECNTKDSLTRIPSIPHIFHKDKKTGQLVKKHIEETKKELRIEKKKLRKVEYK